MKDARDNLKSGMFWLGSTGLVAQVMDVVSLIAILAFLTEADLGVATLSWSLAVVLEAFNGMGTGASLLQAREVDRDEIDSIFWYAAGLSLLLFGVMALAAPWIAKYYAVPELSPMIVVSALKLPLVSVALVPIQLLNRSLRFKDIAMIQATSTLLSSILKIVLAASGLGAWALVIANTAYGLFTLIGAATRHPYLPRLYFSWAKLRRHCNYGYKLAASSILYHFYKNADFLIIGKVFGKEALGLYRVAFDIAMTPPLTVLAAVNRTAFPVFSRLQDDRNELGATFMWMQRGLAFLAAAIAAFLTFAGSDILGVFHEGRWVPVAPVLAVLAWAAVPRCLAHVFPELYKAVRRPELAFYQSVLTFVILVGGILGIVALLGTSHGLMPVALVWLVANPLIVYASLRMARSLIPVTTLGYLSALKHPLLATIAAVLAAWALASARALLPANPWISWSSMIVLGATVVGIFWLYLRFVLGLTLEEMLGKERARVRSAPR